MIIHTRTRLCDFPSTFAVCPSMLEHGEVDQIRKKVLLATRSIDSLRQDEVRHMVYTCGKYVVAGMVSFLKNLADDKIEDEKFYTDEKGRGIYAFVGFVFQSRNQGTPLINKKVLWDNFKTYMGSIWERNVLETQVSNYVNIALQDIIETEPAGAESASDMTMYAMKSDSTPAFLYWLEQASKGTNVSFCSNITDFRVVKDKPFSIITTTANIVDRMKRGGESSTPTHSSNHMLSNVGDYPSFSSPEKKNQSHKAHSSNGKRLGGRLSGIWVIMLGILFISIIFLILLK